MGRVDFKDVIAVFLGLLMEKGQWKDSKQFKEQYGLTISDANFRKVMKSIARLKWAERVNVYLDKNGKIKNDQPKGH